MTTIDVLLVDDHRVVTEGLEVLLSTFDDVSVAGAASSADAALEMYDALDPDVVLMDLSMPGTGGIDATRQLLERDPGARVIVLSGFVAENLVQQVLESGACGYLLKSAGGDELVQAIRAAAGGRAMFSGEALNMMPGRSDRERLGADLTRRELDVLELLVHGLSNKEIAGSLTLSPGTVRVYVSSILSKLHVENRTAAAFVAREHHLLPSRDGDDLRAPHI